MSTKEKTPEQKEKDLKSITERFPIDPLGSFRWWMSYFNRGKPESEMIYADDAFQFDVSKLVNVADKYEKNGDYQSAATMYERVNELTILQMSMDFPKIRDEGLRTQYRDRLGGYLSKSINAIKRGIEAGQLKKEVWESHITRNEIICEMTDDVLNRAALFYKNAIIDAQTKESEAKEKEEKRTEAERRKSAG